LVHAVLREAAPHGAEIDEVHLMVLIEAGEDDRPAPVSQHQPLHRQGRLIDPRRTARDSAGAARRISVSKGFQFPYQIARFIKYVRKPWKPRF
jgi:hypothetical protein